MLLQWFYSPELQKAVKTNAFSILVLPRASTSNENQCFFNTFAPQSFKKQCKLLLFQYSGPSMSSQDFPVLVGLSETMISLRNCNLNSSVFGLRAPRADFEDLENYAEALKHNENQSFFHSFAPQSVQKQFKPMLFQYFCFPKLEKATKTNAFSICWFLMARSRF